MTYLYQVCVLCDGEIKSFTWKVNKPITAANYLVEFNAMKEYLGTQDKMVVMSLSLLNQGMYLTLFDRVVLSLLLVVMTLELFL